MSQHVESLNEHLEGREVGLDVGLLFVGQTEVVVVLLLYVIFEAVVEQYYGIHRLLHHHDLSVNGQLVHAW